MNTRNSVAMIVVLIGSVSAQGAGDSFKIEAEDYVSESGIRLETCADDGGGQNVAYISDMDWCLYENIELGTNALLNFRVFSAFRGEFPHTQNEYEG